MDRERRAIIYVAWGEKHLAEATQSAHSAASVGADRILITNAATLLFLKQKDPFERVILHEFRLRGPLAKSEMFDLLPEEYGSFLFLDTDTRILLDISQGFEKAATHGLAAVQAAHYSLEHFWGFASVLKKYEVKSADLLQYNAGVIFFTRQRRVWEVLKTWSRLCEDAGDAATAWGDQPYLTLAMEMLNFNPYTLSLAYNYRGMGELASGNIRIWHSHYDPPPDLNHFDRPWPPRRFLRDRRLPD